MVGGEDPHPVQRRSRVLGRGQQAPNDFILPKLDEENRLGKDAITGGRRGLLNLEFTFRGTAAAKKGDKDQFSVCSPDKITPRNRCDLWVWVQK